MIRQSSLSESKPPNHQILRSTVTIYPTGENSLLSLCLVSFFNSASSSISDASHTIPPSYFS